MGPREFTLVAFDRDGTRREFTVTEEPRHDRRGWIYRIMSWSRAPDFFEASVFVVSEGVLQFDIVDHHGIPEFKAKGIPEALYRMVASDKRSEVHSSSTRPDPNHPDADWLSEAGGKLWRRLEASGDARYDTARARWILRVRPL